MTGEYRVHDTMSGEYGENDMTNGKWDVILPTQCLFQISTTGRETHSEPVSSIRYQLACAYREDSNESAQLHSLLSVLVFPSEETLALGYL